MVQFLRFAFPPLFETFQAQFGVSNTATGLLFSILMLCYSLSQFPSGVLSDQYGKIEVITLSVLGLSIGAILVVVAPTFTLIVLSAAMIGAMSGAHKTISVPLLSHSYQDRTGFALGLFETIGQLGGGVAPIVIVIIFALFLPWQTVFIIGSAVCILLGILFYVRVTTDETDSESLKDSESSSRDDIEDRTAIENSTQQYLGTLKDVNLVLFVLVTLGFTFAWNGISSFLPLFLITEKGISSSLAGLLYSMIFFAGIIQIVTGDLSDRFGRVQLSIVLFGTMIFGLGSLLLSDVVSVLAIATVILGVGIHGFRPVRDAYLIELMPEDVEGGLFGLLRTVKTGVGSVAPIFVGFVSDIVSFTVAFSGLLVAMVLAVTCLLLMRN